MMSLKTKLAARSILVPGIQLLTLAVVLVVYHYQTIEAHLSSVAPTLAIKFESIASSDSRSQTILLSICAIVFITTMLVAMMLKNVNVKNGIDRIHHQKSYKFQTFLSGLVTTDFENEHLINQEKDVDYISLTSIKNKEDRKLLLEEIKTLHNLISGNEKKRLTELYKALGYIDDLRTMTQSSSWRDTIIAIKEIKQFELVTFKGFLKEKIKDSNKNISESAFESFIALSTSADEIFEQLSAKPNRWEKHLVLEKVLKLEAVKAVDFETLVIKFPLQASFIFELNQKVNKTKLQSDTILSQHKDETQGLRIAFKKGIAVFENKRKFNIS